MFYSQFILAKKGPLGTIWIAAHLERKLRKNQVADTDIGVSVDSILFPDAPIALRLSSHLLLGVVRIYSKKVNYLFNDCSEALIKIKHAFRSTAVDLPPEESTAPYHSITLPENFDLDNFELPDSAFLDSNFVDHHISTREQITLQDTVNDTAFPTSKFGLDERFGDEDVELDEELFMDRKVSPHHDEVSLTSKVSGLHHGETSVPSTSTTLDVPFGRHEEKYDEIPNELSELLSNTYNKNCFSGMEDLRRDVNSSQRHSYTIQTPDLNEIFRPECPAALSSQNHFNPYDVQTPFLIERAQEPSTPALLEVVPSHLQEVPALSPHEKVETCVDSSKPGSCSPYAGIECSEAGNKTFHACAKLGHKPGETAQGLPFSSALINPMYESLTPTYCNSSLVTDNTCLVSGAINRPENGDINHSVFSNEAISLTSPPKLAERFEHEPVSYSINMDVSGDILNVKRTPLKGSSETTEIANLRRLEDGHSCLSMPVVGSELPSLHFTQTSLQAGPATSNICTENLNVSWDILNAKRTLQKGGNEPAEVAGLGCLEDGHSCVNTSVVGSDSLSRTCASNLHLPSSPFMQTTPFEAEPATSSICTDNMDVSADILDVKRTQLKGGNEATQITNIGHLEDDHSCISTLVVESDSLPRSRGSNPLLPTSPFMQTAPFEAEPASSNICTANMDVSGVKLDLRRTPQQSRNAISNLGRGEDVGSDFLSRSYGSNLQLPSSIFVDGDFDLSLRDNFFSHKNPMREEVQLSDRSIFEVQGDGLHCNNDRFINLEGSHMSGYTTSDFKYSARKPNELSMGIPSKVSHLDNEKHSSSSDFLGPEKMLAPTFVDFPTFQALQGAGKGATQSEGIIDKISGQYNRKRPSMDSSAILQNSASAKLSVLPSSIKRADYIPDDADLLTTILDGRTALSSKTGSNPPLSSKTGSVSPLSSKTIPIPPFSSKVDSVPPISSKTDSIPPLSKPSFQKRPRTVSKVGMLKRRKVLVDDAMVLHADAIRQQLINTEDIRRMRKKAPCTRPEIWKIYISATEDDIFDRSILTGISAELDSLYNLRYDAQKDSSPLELNSQVNKTSGDMGSWRVADKELNERLLSAQGSVNRNDGPWSITESTSVQTHESDAQVDLYDQFQKLPVRPQGRPFRNDHVVGSFRDLEFLNDMGDTDRHVRISSVHSTNRNGGSPILAASATVQNYEDVSQRGMNDQLQKMPAHYPAAGRNSQGSVAGPSTVLEFLNEMGDNEMDEKISYVNRNDGQSSTNRPATVQTREVGAQYNQLQKAPPAQPQAGPFRNDHASVTGSSRALEFVNDIGDKERNETIPSVHSTNRNDSPSNITAPATMKTNEVGAERALYDQLQKLSVHSPQATFSNNQASIMGSSTALGVLNEMNDKEHNERISSVHRNDGPSSMNEFTRVQTREVGVQYNLYDQLQRLPVQPQVGSFSNNQAYVISAMQPDAETCSTSIIQTEEYDTRGKTSAVTDSSKPLEFSSENRVIEMNERISSVPSIVNRNFGPSRMPESATAQTHEGGAHCEMYDQLNMQPVQPQVRPFGSGKVSVICTMHPNVVTCPNSIIQETPICKCVSPDDKITNKSINMLEVGPFDKGQASLTCITQPDAETRANSIILENPIQKTDRSISSVEKLTNNSINHAERSLHSDAQSLLNFPDNGSASTLVGIDSNIAVEPLTSKSLNQTEKLCNAAGAIVNKEEKTGTSVDTSHSETICATNITGGGLENNGAVEGLEGEGRPVSEVSCAEQNRDEGRPVSDVAYAEQNNVFFSSSVNHAPSTVGENNGIKEFKLEGTRDVDSMPVNIGAARDSIDFCRPIDDHDTVVHLPAFLDEDDEIVINEAGDNAPNSENAQSLENSGWSARTRGVARYLKNLFDEESGQGRKSIAVNRLLVGKTRKEASRMFFETLVLKTRDYIQVEQERPYEYIDITPRIKLLKSEF